MCVWGGGGTQVNGSAVQCLDVWTMAGDGMVLGGLQRSSARLEAWRAAW